MKDNVILWEPETKGIHGRNSFLFLSQLETKIRTKIKNLNSEGDKNLNKCLK